ncbi:MAG: hypothetical protein IPJ21_14875 [Sterolibacteriaceae bacterium]|nr:hypothetical protein [Sterolibacteriaceae bacterium]MBK9085061.1 hypothetical protein [Sterolibacteriaceae bacterium]
MNGPERKLGPIEVRWGDERYTYYIIGDSFYTEWKRGMDCAKSVASLHGLSSNLTETVGRSQSTTRTLRISMLLMASSVVVFFSDYNNSIPLLAPFLLGLGGWWFVSAIRKVAPRAWTNVRKSSGDEAFYMVQPEHKSEEWSRFEAGLSESIRQVNAEKT